MFLFVLLKLDVPVILLLLLSATSSCLSLKLLRLLPEIMELMGYSSLRIDNFPAGLRVLVVDDDPIWLKILEKMLKKCSYEGMFVSSSLATFCLFSFSFLFFSLSL